MPTTSSTAENADVERQEPFVPAVQGGTSNRLRVAYIGVLLFSIVYFGRPEDWIPGVASVPFAKITAALALIAFPLSLGARSRKLPKEMWLLIALFAQLVLAIPFSSWRGGSFELVMFTSTKITAMTLVLVQCITTLARLRRLLFVHTLAVCVVAAVSIVLAQMQSGRLLGALGGIFGNPNDLAASITLVFPFAIVFFMLAKNPFTKVFWLISLPIMGYALVETLSRAGFLSMIVVIGCCIFFLSKRHNRIPVIFATLILLVAGFVGTQARYQDRIASIVNPALDESGSYNARNDLLQRSIELAVTHPIFGIGPGQFAEYSKNWHAAHNTFTELAAEAGLPAGILFVWMLWHALKKLLRFRRQEKLRREVKLFASALAASMLGLFVTLCFSSVEYLFLPYFLVGYVSALVLVGGDSMSPPSEMSEASMKPTRTLALAGADWIE